MGADAFIRTIDALRAQLCDQAELFDDPTTYTAGVLDTLEALTGRLPETTT